MPEAPLRFCSAPNCNARVRSGRCPVHAAQQKQHYSRHYRGGGLYGRKWDKTSKRYLETHYLCVHCLREGHPGAAKEVDHIVPHRGDRTLFWQESNWQPLCKHHHSMKTAAEAGLGKTA